MKFGNIALGLGIQGVSSALKSEVNSRAETANRNELDRRNDLIAHRAQTLERIKQTGLTQREQNKSAATPTAYNKDGFPVYPDQVDAYRQRGEQLFDKANTRSGSGGGSDLTKKQKIDLEGKINTGYNLYLKDDFSGSPMPKDEWALENLPSAYAVMYPEGEPAPAPEEVSDKESKAAEMLVKLGIGEKEKSFKKPGANSGIVTPAIDDMPVATGESDEEMLYPGQEPGDVMEPAPLGYDMPVIGEEQDPPMLDDVSDPVVSGKKVVPVATPTQEMPTVAPEEAKSKTSGIVSRILNGSFDISDVIKGVIAGGKGAAKGAKELSKFLVEVSGWTDQDLKADNIEALKKAVNQMSAGQEWGEEKTAALLAKIAEGSIESIKYVAKVMTAETDQKEAYFSK